MSRGAFDGLRCLVAMARVQSFAIAVVTGVRLLVDALRWRNAA